MFPNKYPEIFQFVFIFYSNSLQDCHGSREAPGKPVQDDTQNYTVINGYQNATHTIIQFQRPLETCDPDDVAITVSGLDKKIQFDSSAQQR